MLYTDCCTDRYKAATLIPFVLSWGVSEKTIVPLLAQEKTKLRSLEKSVDLRGAKNWIGNTLKNNEFGASMLVAI